MEFLREHRARRAFSLFTGIMFLNMSFLLSGVSLLFPDNKELIENVGKVIISEEEKGAHDPVTDTHAKVLSCTSAHGLMKRSALFLIAEKIHHERDGLPLRDGHSQTFSPPPELHYRAAGV